MPGLLVPARGAQRAPAALARARALACALVALAAAACAPGEPAPPPAGEVVRSFFALGDTGVPSLWPALVSRQRAVAEGLAAEDRRDPVDAVVLLGDNFYDEGLTPEGLVAQLRENLVGPYCRFLVLDGPRAGEVEGACGVPRAERRAIPFLAVLGNHDYKTPESPRLQVDTVPLFARNWRVSGALAETVPLGDGVDLVLVDSERLVNGGGDAAAVGAALAAAPGPFRVIAAHHPMALADGQERDPAGPEMRYREALQRVLAEAGVPAQLFLAGHAHSLQVLTMAPPAPPLHVVSGAGGRPKPVRFESAERRFGLEATGFARVDLVRRDGADRLVVSLLRTGSRPFLAHAPPRLVARWSVDAAGAVRDEGVPQ